MPCRESECGCFAFRGIASCVEGRKRHTRFILPMYIRVLFLGFSNNRGVGFFKSHPNRFSILLAGILRRSLGGESPAFRILGDGTERERLFDLLLDKLLDRFSGP